MSIPFQEKPICPISEACEVLDCGVTKVYELFDINGGPLETVMIGRRRMIKVPSLLRLAESGVDPRPATPPRRTGKRPAPAKAA